MTRRSTIVLITVCVIEAAIIGWLCFQRPRGTQSPAPSARPKPVISESDQFWSKWLFENRSKIESQAETTLKSWVQKNPIDSSQIEEANVTDIDRTGPWIRVTMYKDNRKTPENHMHDAFFHILFDTSFDVVFQQRGPDEIE